MQIVPISRKFLQPILPPTFLHRENLVRRLNEAVTGFSAHTPEKRTNYRLILLYAPAGYGKTTLLADLAQHTDLPCCWYHLDATDTDKLTFLAALIGSLQHRFSWLAEELGMLLTSLTAPDVKHLVNTMYLDEVVNDLVNFINTKIPEHFAFLLCGYQEINEHVGINTIVNCLLQNTHCVFVIESRVIPDLDFAHFLAHREVFTLNSQDLRFTTQDICDLASLQGMQTLHPTKAEHIAASFDGWIMGILLGTQVGGSQFLQTPQHDQHYLFRYVVNEVFQHEMPIYLFLKEAAILQYMTPFICTELLAIADAEAYLTSLERRGLFVTRQESDSQIIYTCNSVLRTLLCEELQRENPARFFALHKHAAEIFLAAHEHEQAIFHALQAQAYEMVIELMFTLYEQTFVQGHIETLERWLRALPPILTANDPRLLLIQATIALVGNAHPQAFILLEAATQQLGVYAVHSTPQNIVALTCTLDLVRSKALFQAGHYQQAAALCQQVLAQLPSDNIPGRAEATLRLGVCCNLLGDIDAGVIHLQKALQLWGRNTHNRQVADAHSALASAYSLIGNFVLAEHHLSRSILCWQELHDEWGKISSLIRRGVMKQRRGAYPEAETDLMQALTLARTSPRFPQGEAYALTNLADLALEQGKDEQTLVWAEDSLALARQLRDNRLITHSLHTLAMTYLLKGDTSTAALLASEIQVSEKSHEGASYEFAIHALVYGTILLYKHQYHEASISLIESEQALEAMRLRHEQCQVQVRLMACYLALKQEDKLQTYLEKITATLANHQEYKHLVVLEIQRHRTLEQMLHLLPTTHPCKAMLSSDRKPSLSQEQPLEHTPTPTEAVLSVVKITFSIAAFGEPTLVVQGKPITHWRMARAMELFFFLLHMGRPTRKESIITALWPEVDEQTDHTFHTTVYYLRKTIGNNVLTSRAGFYTLNLALQDEKQAWYDVNTFQKNYALAKQALHNQNDALAKEALLKMVKLYHGDYLQPLYSDWCTPIRDNLRTVYLDAHRELAQIEWRNKAWNESLFHWQQMLSIDNCLEEAHYGVIRCYIHQGKRSLAFRHYQFCKGILAEELGLQPSQSLQSLYQHMIAPDTFHAEN